MRATTTASQEVACDTRAEEPHPCRFPESGLEAGPPKRGRVSGLVCFRRGLSNETNRLMTEELQIAATKAPAAASTRCPPVKLDVRSLVNGPGARAVSNVLKVMVLAS